MVWIEEEDGVRGADQSILIGRWGSLSSPKELGAGRMDWHPEWAGT